MNQSLLYLVGALLSGYFPLWHFIGHPPLVISALSRTRMALPHYLCSAVALALLVLLRHLAQPHSLAMLQVFHLPHPAQPSYIFLTVIKNQSSESP